MVSSLSVINMQNVGRIEHPDNEDTVDVFYCFNQWVSPQSDCILHAVMFPMSVSCFDRELMMREVKRMGKTFYNSNPVSTL